jgi:DNA-binding beta-propeller fold protein YncE
MLKIESAASSRKPGKKAIPALACAQPRRLARWLLGLLAVATATASLAGPQVLALEKADGTLAIIDAASLKIIGRVAVGPDPHEVIASQEGARAYISNYGGEGSDLHQISVVNLADRKALAPIDLGTLHSAHGLWLADDKLYFTAETNKVIGRYDLASQRIDWVMGTGQDRTHLLVVLPGAERIITSNVRSGTISIIERVSASTVSNSAGAPPRTLWTVTDVRSGEGSEGFDVTPDGKQIWAANAKDGTITIIDAVAKKALQTLPISVRGANRLKFTPDGRRALISGLGGAPDYAGENFAIFDVASRKEVKGLNLGGGAAGILVTPDGTRAFVAVSPRNRLAVVDLKSLTVVHEIATGKGPDGLAWVSGK